MTKPNRFTPLLEAVKALEAAERVSLAAAERRGALPPGTSRARVTTANADWARKAEGRDHKIEHAEAAAVAALTGLVRRSGS
jgi:hypothetical protein